MPTLCRPVKLAKKMHGGGGVGGVAVADSEFFRGAKGGLTYIGQHAPTTLE